MAFTWFFLRSTVEVTEPLQKVVLNKYCQPRELHYPRFPNEVHTDRLRKKKTQQNNAPPTGNVLRFSEEERIEGDVATQVYLVEHYVTRTAKCLFPAASSTISEQAPGCTTQGPEGGAKCVAH